jgi:hypothetical protein
MALLSSFVPPSRTSLLVDLFSCVIPLGLLHDSSSSTRHPTSYRALTPRLCTHNASRRGSQDQRADGDAAGAARSFVVVAPYPLPRCRDALLNRLDPWNLYAPTRLNGGRNKQCRYLVLLQAGFQDAHHCRCYDWRYRVPRYSWLPRLVLPPPAESQTSIFPSDDANAQEGWRGETWTSGHTRQRCYEVRFPAILSMTYY